MRLTRKGRKLVLGSTVVLFFITLITCGTLIYRHETQKDVARGTDKTSASSQTSSTKTSATTTSTIKEETPTPQTILMTFMGDNTLGTDTNFNSATSLPTVWANNGNDPHYFFKNVADLFTNDDLTVANLETTFTTSSDKADKGTGTVFHFKGDPSLVNTLTASSIEAVTVSNNHIYDYGQQGFDDTIATLKSVNLGFFGEGYKFTTEVKGVKIGLLGYQAWYQDATQEAQIKQDITDLRSAGCQLVIPYFHWGIERDEYPNDDQVAIAHFCIDNGADLVIGSHPHVIQSMEVYKGKLIAYSMGNFAFGGNSNPSDKRTFILQTEFTVTGAAVTDATFKVIPTRISSTDSYNDYVPTPYTGQAATDVLNYMNQLSPTLNNQISSDFVAIPQN